MTFGKGPEGGIRKITNKAETDKVKEIMLKQGISFSEAKEVLETKKAEEEAAKAKLESAKKELEEDIEKIDKANEELAEKYGETKPGVVNLNNLG